MSLSKPDHTLLSTLDRCEQELVWRHLVHLKPTEEPASAHFGKMLHYGVRALYEGLSLTDAIVTMLHHWHDGPVLRARAAAAVLGAPGESWRCPTCMHSVPSGPQVGSPSCPNCTAAGGPTPGLTMPMFLLVDAKKPWLGAHEAQRWLALYYNTYLRQGRELDRPVVPAAFKVIWNEGYAESATESGLPDRAVETQDGLVWAMDLKTTGMWLGADTKGQTPGLFRHYEHNMQAAMQIDLLEDVLQRPVAGFWLDVINVKAKGLPSYDGLRRYGPLPYAKGLREELRAQRTRKAQRIQRLLEHPEEAEKRLGACIRYNSLCPYFDLCRTEPAERETLVRIKLDRGDYTEEAWEPKTRG